MNTYIGYLHSDDGWQMVGPDGFPDSVDSFDAVVQHEPADLEAATIDAAPVQVTGVAPARAGTDSEVS